MRAVDRREVVINSDESEFALLRVLDLPGGLDRLVALAQHLLQPRLVERRVGRLPKLAGNLAFVVDLKPWRGLPDRDRPDVHLVLWPRGNDHRLLDQAARCLNALLNAQPAVLQLGL